MTLPERIDADWIATLSNEQLARAEAHLHTQFSREESAEKKRRGNAYDLMPVLDVLDLLHDFYAGLGAPQNVNARPG